MAEIQRLASSAAEMQAELAFRPTRSDIDDLTALVGELRTEVFLKDQQLERLHATLTRERFTLDKAIGTSRSLEDLSEPERTSIEPSLEAGNISAEIDEMFRLDFDEDEDDDTDSVTTEINREESFPIEQSITIDRSDIPGGAGGAGEYVRLDDEERLQVTLQNGSLHALEEELVRAKERWAEASTERARLAAQLAALQSKSVLGVDTPRLLALALPLIAICLYYVFLPYLS